MLNMPPKQRQYF